MPDGGLSSTTDVNDFTRGTDFLSASGGGAPTEALELLNDDVERGVALRWTDLASLPDDALCVSTFFHGSIAPESFDTADIERECGVSRIVKRPLVQAVQELEQHLGRTRRRDHLGRDRRGQHRLHRGRRGQPRKAPARRRLRRPGDPRGPVRHAAHDR